MSVRKDGLYTLDQRHIRINTLSKPTRNLYYVYTNINILKMYIEKFRYYFYIKKYIYIYTYKK